MVVNKDKCIGCRTCADVCPVGAITMENGKAKIDTKKCIKCGTCMAVCPENAISNN